MLLLIILLLRDRLIYHLFCRERETLIYHQRERELPQYQCKMKRARSPSPRPVKEETSSGKTGHANGQARPRPPKEETSSGKTGHATGQARPRPLAPPMAARGPSHLHARRPEWRHICFFCPEEFRCVPKIPACLGKDPPNRDEHGCRCLKHCDFRPDMVFCSNKCFWEFNGSHPY